MRAQPASASERLVRSHRRPGAACALRAGLSLACAAGLGAHLAAASQGALAPIAAAPAAAGFRSLDVAVAPFLNLSRQPDDDWIGDGIAETVATDLRARGWTVTSCAAPAVGRGGRSRAAATAAWNGNANGNGNGNGNGNRGRGPDPAGCLGPRVRLRVAGAYERLGDQLHVTAEVIDAATGAVAHRARLDGPAGDLFALQDRLVSTLADSLAAVRGPSATSLTGSLAFEPAAMGSADANASTNAASSSRDGHGDGAAAASAAPASPGSGARQGTGLGGFTIAERPRAVAARTNQPPRIDGRLDDAVWLSVEPITDFVADEPGGRRSRDGADRGVDRLRPRPPLPRLLRALLRPRHHPGEPGGARPVDGRRPYGGAVRPVPRSAASLPVLGERLRRAGRLDRQRRRGARRAAAPASGARAAEGAEGAAGAAGAEAEGAAGASRPASASAATVPGTRCSRRAAASSRTAGRQRWPSRSRASATRRGRPASRTAGASRSAATSGRNPSRWSGRPSRATSAGQLTQMGMLEGLRDLSTSRNLEFLPTFTGLQVGSFDGGSGGFRNGDPLGEIGVGVKYGVTSNLTLDLTYNPDFSQIESDRPQVEVNQRFALFYPEQRPFFLEGQEIFAAGDAGQSGAHAHDRRPALRGEAHREGRRHDARRVRRRRRGRRSARRRVGPGLRELRAVVHRTRALRPLSGIVPRGPRHHAGARGRLHPRGAGSTAGSGSTAPTASASRPPAPRTGTPSTASSAGRSSRSTSRGRRATSPTASPTAASSPASAPARGSSRASTSAGPTPTSATAGGRRAG